MSPTTTSRTMTGTARTDLAFAPPDAFLTELAVAGWGASGTKSVRCSLYASINSGYSSSSTRMFLRVTSFEVAIMTACPPGSIRTNEHSVARVAARNLVTMT